MDFNKYNKKELVDIVKSINNLLQKKEVKGTTKKKDLESLIGSLPFLLLNEAFFEKNLDVANFGEKLGIRIPSPEKKKKEDIIGRIVSAVSKFDKRKIEQLNTAIDNLNKKSTTNKDKNNFFNEWEEAIKNIDL